ncbi:hypothetical protein BCR41DRAFT_374676 [Lobosporangium transversale]|uniref:Uncharacterized protein n=1 Tax=Lobosporangium transversale TaxID=64571 RepID=A0A1Y2G9U0_9FUNG|nr:hypothetical protein BCR41DRAFT_374676 [Lobosporangium transversale]ORZ05005.1 hypothetical protein BCR41DRAFT_374676 [Lobosporangium transversale]|eukprot:XP_021876869.1 hypothetical protein BCR41DRAFT_374676 [Lobosporangium transversale]
MRLKIELAPNSNRSTVSNTSFQGQEAVTDAPIDDVLAINQIEKILIGGFEDILSRKALDASNSGKDREDDSEEREDDDGEKGDNDQVDILAGHEFDFEFIA